MAIQRRIPKIRDLAPLMKFKKPTLDFKTRRLQEAHTIYDLREIAKRRTPKAPFDYTDGSAEQELSIARARQAFEDVEFHPSILRDVSHVDTGWDVLGRRVALPFGIAPTGFTRMMQTEGEAAGAAAAAAAGIPFSLSTMGTSSIEDVAAAGGPNGRNWFQLYMWKDRDRSMALVERAAKAGFDTLLVTVDVPVAGARLRDSRNGMTIPPTLTPKTVLNAIPRPEWWINFLTTEPLAFASLDRWSGTVAQLLDTMFDPTVTFEDLAWIKSQWPGSSSSKASRTWTMPSASPTSAWTRSCCPTTAAVSSTGRPSPSTSCRTSCARWARTPRCTSIPASCRARTSSRRSPSARGSRSSGARTSTG
ncbi:hypothetical protein GCM10025866_13560 [Naasia aerilata]|uniref:FMN hydroxy acid dehydrogenase domain-containing protein n=1 Tax=Naasia aerilata TaxID=1162966 RepID=A0ABN6XKL0_9MICO|nr:hypothetical protein GCM10025866_13560 [Naasia aerilata]